MSTLVLAGLVVAYVLIAVLLLSLNFLSRWRWWVKAGAVVITSAYFVGAYAFSHSLLGWATDERLPPHFQLLWGKVVEPAKLTGEPGAIYLWVDELDSFNVPMDQPRNYVLPYSDELADRVLAATQKIQEGIEVSGSPEVIEPQEPADEEDLEEAQRREGEEGRYDVEVFPDEGQTIQFQEMPAPLMPEKEVI